MNDLTKWQDAKIETPGFDNINYLTIAKKDNHIFYSFDYWNGDSWDSEFEILFFTETDPLNIVKLLKK